MHSVSNNISSVSCEGVYNPKSFGYRAMIHAAKGQLELLRKDLEKEPEELDRLQVVSKDGVQMYTALHYAVAQEKWTTAALLINRGMSWDVGSKKKGGAEGPTAIAMIDRKEGSLVKLFEGLLETGDPIDVEAWFFFLTSSNLGKKRRLEVLEEGTVKERFCKTLSKKEGLLMMASLMTGLFQFRPNQTDFSKDLYTGDVNYTGTINCSQFLFAASIESGHLTRKELIEGIDRMNRETEFSKEAVESTYDLHRDRVADDCMLSVHRRYSEFMGVVQSEECKYRPGESRIRLFAAEGKPGIFEHYGLLFLSKDGTEYVLNINRSSLRVACQRADEVFSSARRMFGISNIYTFMLPWQMD